MAGHQWMRPTVHGLSRARVRPRLHGFGTSPVRVPRRASPGGHSFKFQAGPKPARVAGPAYGPLTMPDPNRAGHRPNPLRRLRHDLTFMGVLHKQPTHLSTKLRVITVLLPRCQLEAKVAMRKPKPPTCTACGQPVLAHHAYTPAPKRNWRHLNCAAPERDRTGNKPRLDHQPPQVLKAVADEIAIAKMRSQKPNTWRLGKPPGSYGRR